MLLVSEYFPGSFPIFIRDLNKQLYFEYLHFLAIVIINPSIFNLRININYFAFIGNIIIISLSTAESLQFPVAGEIISVRCLSKPGGTIPPESLYKLQYKIANRG